MICSWTSRSAIKCKLLPPLKSYWGFQVGKSRSCRLLGHHHGFQDKTKLQKGKYENTECSYYSAMPAATVSPAEASSVHKIPNDSKSLSAMLDKLHSGLPGNSVVYGCVKNAAANKISAQFFTDGWPHFTTTICQVFRPRISDVADLFCYNSTSNSFEKLLPFFLETNIVSFGKWQLIEGLEKNQADMVVSVLKEKIAKDKLKGSVKSDYQGSLFYYPLHDVQVPPLQKDFVLDQLQPQHVEHIVANFPAFRNERKPEVLAGYLNELVKTFKSAGIFKNDDRTRPLGWMYRNIYGGMGWHFVSNECRGMGASQVIRSEIIRLILEDQMMPVGFFARDFAHLAEKSGMNKLYDTKKVIVA